MKKIELEHVQLMLLETFKEIDRICRKNDIPYYMIGGTLIGAARHKGFIPWDDDVDIAMMRSDYERFLNCCKDNLNKKYFLQNYHTDVDFYPPITRICIPGTFIDEYYSDHLKFNKSLYMDIFPIDNIPDDEKTQKKHAKKILIIDTLIFYKLCMVYNKGPLHIKMIAKKIIRLFLLPVSLKRLQNLREKVMMEHSAQKTRYVCNTASKYGYLSEIISRDSFGDPIELEFENGKFFAMQSWNYYLSLRYGNYMELPPESERKPMHEVYEI